MKIRNKKAILQVKPARCVFFRELLYSFAGIIVSGILLTAHAATYYVSSSAGSDSNDGLSTGSPLATLSYAADQVSGAGDSVLLKRGDAWSDDPISLYGVQGSSSNTITISAYGNPDDAMPVIKNNSGSAIFIQNSQGIVISFINFQYNHTAIDLFYPFRNGREYMRIRNCMFLGNGDSENNDGTGGCIRFSGDYQKQLQLAKNCNIKDVLIESCLAWNNESFVWCEIFDNINAEDYITYPIRNLKISNCSSSGSDKYVVDARYICNETSYGPLITGCTFLDNYIDEAENGSCAVLLRGCNTCDIYDTEVGYSYRMLVDGPDGEGIDFEGNDVNCTIDSCYIHHCDGPAIMIYGPGGKRNEYNKIVNCLFEKNNQSALHPEDCEIWVAQDMVTNVATVIASNTYYRVPGIDFMLIKPDIAVNMDAHNNQQIVADGEQPFDWVFHDNSSGIPPIEEGCTRNVACMTKNSMNLELAIDNSLSPGMFPFFSLDGTHFYSMDTGLDLDSDTYDVAYICIKNLSAATQLRICWQQSLALAYNITNSKTISITPNSSTTQYITVNLANSAAWTGNIEKIQIQFPGFTSGTGTIQFGYFKIR